jgi:hypothetical protein
MSGNLQVIWASVFAAALLTWAGMRELGYAEFGEFGKLLARRYLPEPEMVVNNTVLVNLKDDLARAVTVPQLWEALVIAAGSLGFHRIEIIGIEPGDARPALPAAPGGLNDPSRLCATVLPHNGASEWEWRVTMSLPPPGRPAQVLLARPASDSDLHFDPVYLVRALREGVGQFLSRSAGVASNTTGS